MVLHSCFPAIHEFSPSPSSGLTSTYNDLPLFSSSPVWCCLKLSAVPNCQSSPAVCRINSNQNYLSANVFLELGLRYCRESMNVNISIYQMLMYYQTWKTIWLCHYWSSVASMEEIISPSETPHRSIYAIWAQEGRTSSFLRTIWYCNWMEFGICHNMSFSSQDALHKHTEVKVEEVVSCRWINFIPLVKPTW